MTVPETGGKRSTAYCYDCGVGKPDCLYFPDIERYRCQQCVELRLRSGSLSMNAVRRALELEPFPSLPDAGVTAVPRMQYRVLYALPTPSVNRRSPGDTETEWQAGEWRDIHPDTHVGMVGGAKRLEFRRKPKRTDAEILAYLRSNYERMVSHRHDVTIWSKILRGEF